MSDLEQFIRSFSTIYHYIVFILGNGTLVILFIAIIIFIYRKIQMITSTKKYVKSLKDNEFIKKSFEPITQEEQELMQKFGRSKKEVKLDFKTMQVEEKSVGDIPINHNPKENNNVDNN